MAELSLTQLQTAVNGKANISHGNHVPAVQTANNAVYLRNDNTWQTLVPSEIGAAPASHTHTKANITDFPTSLPANGGNADTVDGYHISDIQSLVSSGFDAGHLFSGNGYQKFSNGLIIQWGSVPTVYTFATITVSFPIAFPNACLSCIPTVTTTGTDNSMGCSARTTTSATFTANKGSENVNITGIYIAIGY